MGIIKTISVPDTLTLEDNAELALNALIGVADEDYHYIPFFNADFKSKPAVMYHGNWDYGSSHGRLVDAIILARDMTGSNYGQDIEQHYRQNLLSFIGPKGLTYRRNSFTQQEIIEHQSQFKDSASMIDQRATLLAFCTWYKHTGDERAKQAADNLCAGLKDIARKERDYWYYPASEYILKEGWPSFDAVHTKLAPDPCSMWGRQIGPLAMWYDLTGNSDAYELCENFAAYIMHHSSVFGPDGSWSGAHEYRNGHFHTRMGTLASLARFAYITHDSEMLNFAKKCFDWAITNKCTTFGWTPGDMKDQQYEHETCTLTDAIDTAILLAKQGYTEYWAIAERFIRNHLTQSQLSDTSWIEQSHNKDKDVLGYKTYYKVADRLRGAFAGYAAPNDFVYDGEWGRGHIMDVQTCCLGAGTRGLYLAWDNIVTEMPNRRISLNLLLNHSSTWLDVSSYLPHEGKLEINAKKDMNDLLIRIPEWTPFGSVRIIRGQTTYTGRQLPWIKNVFIRIPQVKAGESITVSFNTYERTTIEKGATLEYQIKWRGDDVIDIQPPGHYYPLYNNRTIYKTVPITEKRLSQA
jgi:hypothetical protein